MSRLSNLTTLKLGIFRSWNTYWFDKTHYTILLFNDLRIRDYLSGIFYKLKVVSDYFYLHRFLNKMNVISTNLIFFSNLKFKSLTLRNVYKIGLNYIFFYRKRHWKSFLYYAKLVRRFFRMYPSTLGILHPINRVSPYSYFAIRVVLRSDILVGLFTFNFKGPYRKIYLNSTPKKVTTASVIPLEYSTLNRWAIAPMPYKRSFLYWSWYGNTYFSARFTMILILIKFIGYKILTIGANLTLCLSYLSQFLTQAPAMAIDHFRYVTRSQNISYVDMGLLISTIDRRAITKSLFNSLRYNIERTIEIFEQVRVYFNFSIFFKKNPFIVSAKVITETLIYLLQSGKKVVPSFFFIRNWQSSLYKNKRILEHTYFQRSSSKQNLNYLFYYASKRFPLIGLRIECSGTHKKGRMARIYFYSSWVKDDILTGRMPNSTMIADIDYYQYFAITKSSSIGIKTWIFLETHLYNNNNKYVSIVY